MSGKWLQPGQVLIEGESGREPRNWGMARAVHTSRPLARALRAGQLRQPGRKLSRASGSGQEGGVHRGGGGPRGHSRGGGTAALSFSTRWREDPLAVQPKLLRAIKEREVRKTGERTGSEGDVSIVAATNRDLQAIDQVRQVSR